MNLAMFDLVKLALFVMWIAIPHFQTKHVLYYLSGNFPRKVLTAGAHVLVGA
jgi:hypothetical protein